MARKNWLVRIGLSLHSNSRRARCTLRRRPSTPHRISIIIRQNRCLCTRPQGISRPAERGPVYRWLERPYLVHGPSPLEIVLAAMELSVQNLAEGHCGLWPCPAARCPVRVPTYQSGLVAEARVFSFPATGANQWRCVAHHNSKHARGTTCAAPKTGLRLPKVIGFSRAGTTIYQGPP